MTVATHRAKNLANSKLASGFFDSAPRTLAPELATQSLGTHQENAVFYWGVTSGCVVAPNSGVPGINTTTARITPGSGLGDTLRHIPLIGGLLGGAGDIVSGAFNTTAGIVTFGQSGTLGRGIGQIAGGAGEIIGRAWSAPNTAIGLAYGGVGMLFGATPHWDSNAAILRFTGMPDAMMPTAMSMGSVNVFGRNSPPNSDNNVGVGVSTGREESLHTVQSRILGPLYFPAHLLGGAISVLTPDQKSWNPGFDYWHRNNFMEQGPMHGRVF